MKRLGSIERNNVNVGVYLVTTDELVSLKLNPYALAFCYKGDVYVSENFMELSKDTRSIIMEHEVAHAIGIDDEVEADKRAILCYSIQTFKEAIRESYYFMNKFAKKDIAYVESKIQERISLVCN